ncbi:MAG: NADH:flavin oxidoreductase, partial [Anaerolineales bacterium]
TRTKVIRIEKDSVIVQQAHREVELPFETIVIAIGVCANRELPDAFQNSELEVHVIGDAVEPRKAINAIQEGFNVGNMI